jgi:hypothetical protein
MGSPLELNGFNPPAAPELERPASKREPDRQAVAVTNPQTKKLALVILLALFEGWRDDARPA